MGDAAGNGEVKAGDQATKQQPESGNPKDAAAAAAAQLPAPDSGEAAAAVEEAPPVLVFLNSASGGKMGPKVKEKIGVLIPESRLFDLQEVKEGKWKPEDKLKLFQNNKGVKVLICGGDGTMGWILSCIDRLRMVSEPSPLDSTPSVLGEEAFPVAMMPLGTGNDLARTFGWGPGFTRNMLKPSFLDKVDEAPPARLDRWLLSVMPYEPLLDDAEVKKSKIPPRAMPSISVMQKFETWESYDAVFCNYFSFGVDAVAASAFHRHRENHPHLFTSRLRNQLWYARKGFPEAGGYPCGETPPPPPVSDYVELRVKATPEGEWETVGLDSTLRGIVVLNLQSYGGGRNLWGTAEAGCSQKQYAKAAPDDGLLEIVGITNIFKLGCIMGFNKVGARAHRVSQAAEVEIRIRSKIHMQIDGEPWLQDKAKINIQHYGRSTCLRGRR